VGLLCWPATRQKKTARFFGLAVDVDGLGTLRAPIDSFRQWPEKAKEVEEEEEARHDG
jgi:hypothetical protein